MDANSSFPSEISLSAAGRSCRCIYTYRHVFVCFKLSTGGHLCHHLTCLSCIACMPSATQMAAAKICPWMTAATEHSPEVPLLQSTEMSANTELRTQSCFVPHRGTRPRLIIYAVDRNRRMSPKAPNRSRLEQPHGGGKGDRLGQRQR